MSKKASKRDTSSPLANMIGPETLKLLSGSGVELIQQVGFDVIRDIILDILTGRNLRNSTETALAPVHYNLTLLKKRITS